MRKKQIAKIFSIVTLLIILFTSFSYAVESTTDVLDEVTTTMDNMLIDELNEQKIIEPRVTDTTDIQDDVYLCDKKIVLDNNVDGNVFIMAEEAIISNEEINGNVFIVAKNITIEKSYVSGSLFLVGEEVTVNAFSTDAYIAGKTVYINSDARILRDVRLGGENIEINGVISRNAYIAADTINITESAIIEGNLDYSSYNEWEIKGSVYGDTKFSKTEEEVKTSEDKIVSYVKDIISSMIYSIIISLFVIFVIPKFIKNNRCKFIEAFGAGIGFLIIVPIMLIMLFITVFGIMSSISLLLLYIFTITIGYTISAIAISDKIYNNTKKDEEGSKLQLFGLTIVTLVALNIISKIPIIGGIISFVLTMIGIGIIILNIIKSR